MLLLHEILDNDAKYVAEILKDAYKIPVELQKKDLSKWFRPLPKFNGYWYSPKKITKKVEHSTPDNAVMILTHRDLYYGDTSADDEWIFGYCMGKIQVVSDARMKGEDSRPAHELLVSSDKYMKRLITMAVHELGHDLVQADHMEEAYWVNAKTGKKYPLGEHCTDNRCVMYEVVDVLTPPASAGHLLIGKVKKYDAGLDEHMQRVYDDWFCDDCRESIVVQKEYMNKVDKKDI
jgi:predicted Zn-dependent protease